MRAVDVVVVGAGVAGLTAAAELMQHGYDVLVREARDRPGGRIETVALENGARADLGASWIGANQPRARELAARAGAVLVATPDRGRPLVIAASGARDPRRRLLTRPWLRVVEARAGARLEAALAARLRTDTAGDLLRRATGSALVRAGLGASLTNIFGVEPDEVDAAALALLVRSAGSLSALVATAGGAQESLVDGGMEMLLRPLVEALSGRIELGRPVHSIAETANSVSVDDVRAAAAVIAVPPPTVAAISFEGPAATAASAVGRLKTGAVMKMVLAYDTPFWRDRGSNGQIWGDDLPFSFTYDVGHGAAILSVFATDRQARALAGVAVAERRAVICETLALALGPEACAPLDYAERDWTSDPFSLGGYGAYVCPDRAIAARRNGDRVSWASAELAGLWPGYVEGAIASGLDAAERTVARLSRAR